MAQAPAKRCPVFPCGNKQPCPVHGKRPYQQARESSSKRGYDRRWQAVRRAFLAENPLCADCEEEGRFTPAEEVHHILSARQHPELFYDPSNLLSLCVSCHSKRTARGE